MPTQQLLHLVIGGELQDVGVNEFRDLTKIDFVGAYPNYAQAYADQVEKDYESFQAAIRSGRFPVETLPSEIEPAIR